MSKEKMICSVDGCDRSHKAKGFCSMHYNRYRRNGDPLYVLKDYNNTGICSISGCFAKYEAKGYCKKHYERYIVHGDPLYSKNRKEIHGLSKTSEYKVWKGIKRRCYNKNTERYPRYGGRGIIMCETWKNSFKAFYEDMGPRPSNQHQIDRIDNDGNYEPTNCQWASRIDNVRNNSNTKLKLEDAKYIKKYCDGSKQSITVFSKKYNVVPETILAILSGKNWKDA